MTTHCIQNSLLGQAVCYPTTYDANVLFAIARQPNRDALHIPTKWYGADIWYAYEVSWLNNKGKPVVAIARFSVPWDSPHLIESKSFKLYLNSFNESRFESRDTVQQRMAHDLSHVAGAAVSVYLYDIENYGGPKAENIQGTVIDDLDIAISTYTPDPTLLHCRTETAAVDERLISHLLKSNCPVTGQPDWATLEIKYRGKQIDHAALLRYIVSFRQHTEFHEHCVERIYCDVMAQCQPEKLFVMARYTRRGGLDINPWRSNYPTETVDGRAVRQ